MVSRLMLLPASLLLSGLAGCASAPADWGRADVGKMTAERGREVPQVADAKSFTTQALSRPLSAETAVQLALINNPDVRRETARLGFAAAEVYDAGRLASPMFSLTRLTGDSSAGANVPQLTLGLAFNFANLLFLPANSRFAGAQFEAAKLDVAAVAMDLAAEVESAWYEAVGADQLAQMRDAAARAQRASADLAQRFFDAGNISARELAMEKAAASQAVLAAISARAQAVESRAALNRLMGLSAAQSQWTLDARLAEPLPKEDEVAALQKLALESRLDLAGLRRTAEAIADRFGFERSTRLVNGIEIGAERERDFDGALDAGPTLALELPLFNWGGGRVAAARAALDQAEAELDGRVLDVSNQVQLAAAKVQATRALAKEFKSALIPQQEAVVAQMQLEQNYMLIGIFELILAKQQEYEAYAGYIEAVRDYWTARTELARAVGRNLPSAQQPADPTLDPTDLLKPKGGGMDHSQHSMDGMKGMEGMDHAGHGAAPAAADPHAGHDMKGMADMPGMDHARPAAAELPKPSASPHAGHDMGGKPMEGMSHESPPAAAKPQAKTPQGPDCAALTPAERAGLDPEDVVTQALLARCGGAAAPTDPHAGHDMKGMSMEGMDDGRPSPAAQPESGHAH